MNQELIVADIVMLLRCKTLLIAITLDELTDAKRNEGLWFEDFPIFVEESCRVKHSRPLPVFVGCMHTPSVKEKEWSVHLYDRKLWLMNYYTILGFKCAYIPSTTSHTFCITIGNPLNIVKQCAELLDFCDVEGNQLCHLYHVLPIVHLGLQQSTSCAFCATAFNMLDILRCNLWVGWDVLFVTSGTFGDTASKWLCISLCYTAFLVNIQCFRVQWIIHF